MKNVILKWLLIICLLFNNDSILNRILIKIYFYWNNKWSFLFVIAIGFLLGLSLVFYLNYSIIDSITNNNFLENEIISGLTEDYYFSDEFSKKNNILNFLSDLFKKEYYPSQFIKPDICILESSNSIKLLPENNPYDEIIKYKCRYYLHSYAINDLEAMLTKFQPKL